MMAFAEVMAMKQNSIELDNDTWYVTAAGPLDEVISVVHQQIERLERIKKQRDGQH